jgi:hypothetical protein
MSRPQINTCIIPRQIIYFVAYLLFSSRILTADVVVRFDPTLLSAGPFPSDTLSVNDDHQKTGLRISLPALGSTCSQTATVSVCSNTDLLNQLDGFSINPRLMVCFSGAIDPNTLQRGITLVGGNTPFFGAFIGPLIGINQIIFDPASNCVFAKPNRVLDQTGHYLLVVTDSLLDTKGKKVTPDPAFGACLRSAELYCREMVEALRLTPLLFPFQRVVAASLFSTMSVTTWLQNARTFIALNEPPVFLPAGNTTIYT